MCFCVLVCQPACLPACLSVSQTVFLPMPNVCFSLPLCLFPHLPRYLWLLHLSLTIYLSTFFCLPHDRPTYPLHSKDRFACDLYTQSSSTPQDINTCQLPSCLSLRFRWSGAHLSWPTSSSQPTPWWSPSVWAQSTATPSISTAHWKLQVCVVTGLILFCFVCLFFFCVATFCCCKNWGTLKRVFIKTGYLYLG